MPTIVLCRPLHASGMALLEARHDVTIRTLSRPSPKELADAMPGAHAVLVGLEKVDEALLARAPDLRIVSRFGVGYDTVDIPACTRRGVVVGVTNGGNDLSVAEHTLMLLLAVARRTIEMDAAVRAGSGCCARVARWANSPAAPSWWSATAASAHASRACAPRSA